MRRRRAAEVDGTERKRALTFFFFAFAVWGSPQFFPREQVQFRARNAMADGRGTYPSHSGYGGYNQGGSAYQQSYQTSSYGGYPQHQNVNQGGYYGGTPTPSQQQQHQALRDQQRGRDPRQQQQQLTRLQVRKESEKFFTQVFLFLFSEENQMFSSFLSFFLFVSLSVSLRGIRLSD